MNMQAICLLVGAALVLWGFINKKRGLLVLGVVVLVATTWAIQTGVIKG